MAECSSASSSVFKFKEGQRCKILCFGDSLTAGYYNSGYQFRPYAYVVSEKLGVSCDHVGLSGWTVGQMRNRIDDDRCKDVCGRQWKGLRSKLRCGQHDSGGGGDGFTHVVVMAGTNDLGDLMYDKRDGLKTTVAGLQYLHEICWEAGCKTVALSIPEHPEEPEYPKMKELRSTVNRMLREWVEENASQVSYCDISEQLTHSEPELWDDGLHFSVVGYETLGSLVAQHMSQVLASDILGTAEAPAGPGAEAATATAASSTLSSATAEAKEGNKKGISDSGLGDEND
jgi:lysophospholipase L1-like esterase